MRLNLHKSYCNYLNVSYVVKSLTPTDYSNSFINITIVIVLFKLPTITLTVKYVYIYIYLITIIYMLVTLTPTNYSHISVIGIIVNS